jgi:predicted ester cyclase
LPAADWAARCTTIFASGGVGLLHHHATHHVTVDTSLGRIYGRDDWVAALVRERAGLAPSREAGAVAWVGASSPGRAVVSSLDLAVDHCAHSPVFGAPTGRHAVLASAMVGMVDGDRVYRVWRFVDHAATARALGVDLDARAAALAEGVPKRGGIPWEFGEVRPALGQAAPAPAMPAPPGLGVECSGPCVRLQAAWNHRRFDLAASMYAASATVEDGAQAIPVGGQQHPWARIVVACPDAVLFFEHAASEVLGPGDARAAIVWRWIGTHTGGGLGMPCGHRLHLRGITLLRFQDQRIARERVVFDELGTRRNALLRTIDGPSRP